MTKYNKLWVALAGLVLMIGMQHYGISFAGFQPVVLDLVVGALTAFGVYQVRNAE